MVSAMQNSGHFFLFFILSFYFSLNSKKPQKIHQIATTTLSLTILGGLIELAQGFMPGRSASWHDLFLDILGVVAGYLLFLLFYSYKRITKITRLLLFLLVFFITVTATHPLLTITGYHLLKTPSSNIVSFRDPFVTSIIRTSASASVDLVETGFGGATKNNRFLRMNFAKDWSSVIKFYDTARYWVASDHLCFELNNPSKSDRSLVLRIQERENSEQFIDLYKKVLKASPGYNFYKLPILSSEELSKNTDKNGKFDKSDTREIQFYSLETVPFEVVLSDLRLGIPCESST